MLTLCEVCSEINNPIRGFICLSKMGNVWIIRIFLFGSKAKGDILHYIEIIYYLAWFLPTVFGTE